MALTIERLIAEVEANPAAAIAQLEALNAAVDRAAQDRTARIDVDVNDDGVKRAEGSSNALSTAFGALSSVVSAVPFGAMYAGATSAASALSALAGAAGGALSAVGSLSGLIGTLPVGFGAVAGGIGATILGLSGVSAGFKAMQTVTSGASNSMATAVTNANNLKDAYRSLKDAQTAVTDAQRNLKDATDAVGRARTEAAKAIKNDARDVQSAVWSEQDAVESLRRAQENLARAQKKTAASGAVLSKETDDFTGKVYEVARVSQDAVDATDNRAEAERGVARAQMELQRAQERTKEAREKLTEADKKGVEGSDLVQSALRRQRDAFISLQKRQEDVARAQERIKRTMEDNARRTAGGAAGANALAQAMKNLSPAGQEFVKFLNDKFKPALDKIKFAAQEGLLPGVQAGLETLMKNAFPTFEKEAGTFAKIVGDHFSEIMTGLTDPKHIEEMKTMFKGFQDVLGGSKDKKTGKVYKGLLDGIKPLAEIFTRISIAATPLTKLLTNDIVRGLDKIAGWMNTPVGKGAMKKFFDDAYKFTKLWWGVLKPLAKIIGDVVKAAQPLAEWMLSEMGKGFEKIAKWTSSDKGQKTMMKFFEDAKPAIEEVVGLVGDLLKAIFAPRSTGDESPFVKLVKQLREDVVPAISGLLDTLDKSDFATKFATLIGHMVDGFSQLSAHDGVLTNIIDGVNHLADAMKWLDDNTDGKSTDIILGLLAGMATFSVAKSTGESVKENLIDPMKSAYDFIKDAPGDIKDGWTKVKSAWDTAKVAGMYAADWAKNIAQSARGWATITGQAIAGAATTVGAWVSVGWAALTAAAQNTWAAIVISAKWVWMQIQAAVNAVKMAGAWAIGIIIPAAEAVAAMIVQAAIIVGRWVWMGVQSLIAAGRMALAWIIAMGPVAWVIAAVIGLAILIIANWDKIKKWTIDAWGKITKWVSDRWNEMWATGERIFNGIKKTITDIWDSIWKWVTDKWNAFMAIITDPNTTLTQKLGKIWDGLKEGFKGALNTIIRWWNQMSFDIPSIHWGPINFDGYRLDFPDIPEFRQFGGPVEKGKPYIVGEKRPEMFVPSTSGRIQPTVPNSGGAGGGLTEQQLDRLLNKVLEKAKPNFDVEQNFYEKVDPKEMSSELAWKARVA